METQLVTSYLENILSQMKQNFESFNVNIWDLSLD